MSAVNYQEEQQLNREQDKGIPHSIATIGTVFDDGVSLIFAGEVSESEKHYPVNTGAVFEAGDHAYVVKVSGTYIAVCNMTRKTNNDTVKDLNIASLSIYEGDSAKIRVDKDGAYPDSTGTGTLGKSTNIWNGAWISEINLNSSCQLKASGADLQVNGNTVLTGTNFAGKNVYMGGDSNCSIVCSKGRFLRPSVANDEYPCYFGESNNYWHYAYIGKKTTIIGYNKYSALGFFGHAAYAQQTLSQYSLNMGYTAATESNYLTILNNLVGILKNYYGLIG